MTALPARKEDGYTYQDYLSFPDELRCEIIGGDAYDMTPAPTTSHQDAALKIGSIVRTYLDGIKHPCRVFISPVDVVLSEQDVVQPDVVIVCDRNKIQQRGIFGAPDTVFEVLSPSTEPKDRQKKRELYERSGVREYFLVNHEAEFVEKYTLTSTGYGKPVLSVGNEIFKIETVGLELAAQDLFPQYD